MKNQFLWYGFGILCTWILYGCFADEVSETDQFASQNDQDIQQYIQENNLDAQGTGSGLFYQITSPTNGQSPEAGDSVRVHFVTKLLSGKIVDSTSVALNRPDRYLLDASSIPFGLSEGIQQMKEGEEAILLVPSYLGYGNNAFNNAPPELPPFSVLVYEITLLEVKSEDDQIAEYIEEQSFEKVERTDSDLRFILINEDPSNTLPEDGDLITVTYVGEFLDGTQFDSSLDSSFSFTLADAGSPATVIEGWDEGLRLMNEGDSAILVIPSELAYGSTGTDGGLGGSGIPPYTPLAFQITRVKSEAQLIFEYIQANGLQSDTSVTSSGLVFAVQQAGTGNTPTVNANAVVSYTASFIDKDGSLVEYENFSSRTFDLSDEDNFSLTDGLKEGILLMQEGERRTLLAPSGLLYGTPGSGPVPGRTPVVYQVELIQVNF